MQKCHSDFDFSFWFLLKLVCSQSYEMIQGLHQNFLPNKFTQASPFQASPRVWSGSLFLLGIELHFLLCQSCPSEISNTLMKHSLIQVSPLILVLNIQQLCRHKKQQHNYDRTLIFSPTLTNLKNGSYILLSL